MSPMTRHNSFFAMIIMVGCIVFGALPIPQAHAASAAFERWVERLWPQARAKGISSAMYSRAFKGVSPDPDVLKRAEHQPEFVKPVWDYLASAVSDKRIANGQEMLRRHGKLLAGIEARYGVDRHILLAIWGMETSYGAFRGKKNVIRSLATLGFQGSRQKFGRSQLLAALQILQRGDVKPARMTGSWAGAMGHTQFIPTTYNAHAVDYTGDGRRDIWGSIADALASSESFEMAHRRDLGI